MKLYEITLTHLAPKDSNTAIKEYLVADNDEAVFDYLTNGEGNAYTDWNYKITGELYIDDGYDDVEERTQEWIKNTFEEQGEHWNDDLYCDLYYGRTIYGWRETKVTNTELMIAMCNNGVAAFHKKK